MTIDNEVCPVCDADSLTADSETLAFKHRGQVIQVAGAEYARCESCGEDFVLPSQARRNDRRIADAKRAADGLLPGDQIARIRRRLSLTQREAATLFGGGDNAFSKYERGDVIQSLPMDRLLRVVDRSEEAYRVLRNVVHGSAEQSPSRAAKVLRVAFKSTDRTAAHTSHNQYRLPQPWLEVHRPDPHYSVADNLFHHGQSGSGEMISISAAKRKKRQTVITTWAD